MYLPSICQLLTHRKTFWLLTSAESLDLPGRPGRPAGPMGPDRPWVPAGPGGPDGPGGPGMATALEPARNKMQETSYNLQDFEFS